MSERFDLVVVGGGIVGLATARCYAETYADARILVIEKEGALATHQSGRNSGVVHSGAYYRPGSRKARFTREGRRELLAYARDRGLRVAQTGKLIVARSPRDLPYLGEIERRAAANSVPGVRRLTAGEIGSLEPAVVGVAALHVPSAAIVDFAEIARSFARDLLRAGHAIRRSTAIDRLVPDRDGVRGILRDQSFEVVAGRAVACAGLDADRLARRSGARPGVRIVPFWGEFYEVRAGREPLVRGLVYAVPDPALPFLEPHFTPDVGGRLWAGPNAVLACSREGYRWRSIRVRDLAEAGADPALWRLLRRLGRRALREGWRSIDRSTYVADLARMVPALRREDLGATRSGVRAQAVDDAGNLVDDFLWAETPHSLHLLHAPSPAATSAMAIARAIAERRPLPGLARRSPAGGTFMPA